MVDGPLSEPIKCVEDMAGRFQAELLRLLPAWKEKFMVEPESLPALEHEVHQAFGRGADFVITGLLAMIMAVPEFEASCEVSRRSCDASLAKGRMRTIRIPLLGGLLVWVRSLYCSPKQGWFRSTQQSEVPGMYVALAQLGFGKGCSPAFEEKIARRAATTHSLAMTQSELEREGIQIDFKTVRRIAYQSGEKLLTLRKRELLAWREPKLVTIFVHDENGRMEKKSQALIDGTLTGPDALCELVAMHLYHASVSCICIMHLYRLGAQAAKSVTFVSDGAPWIWDRIDQIISHAGIPKIVTIFKILDVCHAVHHVSVAIGALGYDDVTRKGGTVKRVS